MNFLRMLCRVFMFFFIVVSTVKALQVEENFPNNIRPANLNFCPNSNQYALSIENVTQIIQQAVTKAAKLHVKATIAVTDREANVLAVFRMKKASKFTAIQSGRLAGIRIPSEFAAISKAGTCSFFGTSGNAFTPRTAGFIVQEHIPPGIDFSPGGPLFGVQFSSLLAISDVNPRLPLGLSADPGGMPLFIQGQAVGGIGVELDGIYGFDKVLSDDDSSLEEIIATAGSRKFEAPDFLRANQIIVDGIRLPFANTSAPTAESLISLNSEDFISTALNPDGKIIPGVSYLGSNSQFRCFTIRDLAVRVVVDKDENEKFAIKSTKKLSFKEVETILYQAIKQAYITRAAIRQPLGSAAEINVAVVDENGEILGIRATPDAPIFGLDVSVQKARSAALFSNSNAATLLRKARFGNYVDLSSKDGVFLNGAIAFSSRGLGFLHRPLFPDGINNTENGPFSTPISLFSPFNVGLQSDLVTPLLRAILNGKTPQFPILNIRNGLQIFAGGVPLYKEGKLVGAVGVSGDGIDQDDLICTKGSQGFEAPESIRCDRIFVRGVRIPWVKFPRHPNL